jgi:hypothetical protein
MIFSRYQRKKMTNQEYFTWKSCPLEMREKEDCPKKQKEGKFITTRPALQEMLKEVLYDETTAVNL